MVMTHTHAKGQGQRSLGSKVKMEKDEHTDRGDCITWLANAVSNKTGDVRIVQECQVFFGFQLPSVLLPRRTNNFLKKYGSSANTVCKLLCSV